MSLSDIETLQAAIRKRWPKKPTIKAQPYIGNFYNCARMHTKIMAKVKGNHGTYIVSIAVTEQGITPACSCYIGQGGGCHHCEALAHTFLGDADNFSEIPQQGRKHVNNLDDLHAYLEDVTLEKLLAELKANGITQKAFAESIGMNPRHLSAIRGSELRNHFFNELGATKLACLWVIQNLGNKS